LVGWLAGWQVGEVGKLVDDLGVGDFNASEGKAFQNDLHFMISNWLKIYNKIIFFH
jgi:hypothetical protein